MRNCNKSQAGDFLRSMASSGAEIKSSKKADAVQKKEKRVTSAATKSALSRRGSGRRRSTSACININLSISAGSTRTASTERSLTGLY
jgi:hypothetical protein